MNYYQYTADQLNLDIAQAFSEQTGLRQEVTIPYVFSGSEMLLQKFGDDFYKGITVTCPGFFGPQGRVLRLPLSSPGLINKLSEFRFNHHRITNFEMETSAIYGLGNMMGHECLSINVIIANRVIQEFSKDSEAAVEKMILRALDVLTTA
jgi:uridine phosphorylase